jgi:hypothetical protein
LTDECPVAQTDGHDLPRLIDESVPGVAAVVDDIVEGFEDPIESQFWRMNCQMFSWTLSSGARDGSGRREMLPGT